MAQKSELKVETMEEIHNFILTGVDLDRRRARFSSDPFWKGLNDVGTELWLDTGDTDAADKLWKAEFSALTTNNTLLNNEVQKGIYDELIKKAGEILSYLDMKDRVMEIAFILNARHGLNLVQKFGGYVSVELHTDSAYDIEKTISYARRFHRILPEYFIIKVPLTPEGLIATRQIREEGIRVNFTLGFSARHNYVAAMYAFPSYVNVFLGRLNAYVADNKLGDGKFVGEKATISSQSHVTAVSKETGKKTRQIAASMRSAGQVRDLAGLDVFTMPVKVAEAAEKELDGEWRSRVGHDYPVELFSGVDEKSVALSKLWNVTQKEKDFVRNLVNEKPSSGEELVARAHEAGLQDLFPKLDKADMDHIATDGKIPTHDRWKDRIQNGELAIDTLLNLAGLASFTADQGKLDDRIKKLIL
jgi:transaldolase